MQSKGNTHTFNIDNKDSDSSAVHEHFTMWSENCICGKIISKSQRNKREHRFL